MKCNSSYLQRRPYRRFQDDESSEYLCSLMNIRFKKGFSGYWQQFGYEIGGPVCYAYVKWFSDLIDDDYPEITDIAFVARDGWLLKQVYEKLPHKRKVNTHYVYAPRTVSLSCQYEAENQDEYRNYLQSLGLGKGAIAVIDTVTMKFSSQRLIAMAEIRPTHGFFWCVLNGAEDYGRNLAYSAYQKERYHTIQNWNVMEFIMTSPEPPILAIKDGKPEYRTSTQEEALRQSVFPAIEWGVLAFVDDVCSRGKYPKISNRTITDWINDFLKHPEKEDITAFEPIRFSERADHSDSIPLDPFGLNKKTFKHIKDKIWLWSQKYKSIYAVLHWGNHLLKDTINAVQSFGCAKYNGTGKTKLVEKLSQYDIVSFDIFDTLILRPYDKPTDLFFDLERDNGLPGFHDNRIRAERDARQLSKKCNGEIDIYDIYTELAKRYEIDARELALEEISQELVTCYANPDFVDIHDALFTKGIRMIAVSDMYLPSEVLLRLLKSCGYLHITEVYVSCEYGAGKYDGSLQKSVQTSVGSDKRIVHIGDNFDSDVKVSKLSGWKAIFYQQQQ